MTNTYYTRVVAGVSRVGCYYDVGRCSNATLVQVKSNTTFWTSQTFITPFYDNMYFFGLNHFIIYHEYNDLDFLAVPFSPPNIYMNF